MAANRPTRSDPPAHELRSVIDLYNRNQLPTAQEKTLQLLRRYPKSAALNNFAGIIRAGLGQPSAAISSYRQAVQLQPDFADAWANLGSTLFATGAIAAAVESFQRLRTLRPDSADVSYNLAVALQANGDYQQAAEHYRETVKQNPDIPEAHNNLGLCLFLSGEGEAALTSYRAALALDPDYAEAHLNLGIVLHKTGALTAALERFDRAIQLNPKLVDAYNHSGNVHTDQGDLVAARRCFEQALSVNPGYADALWNLAGASTRFEECRGWLQRCLQVNENHLHARLLLAGLEAVEGELARWEKVQQSSERDHAFVRSFAWVLALPRPPQFCFNRWSLFDSAVALADKSRPFYEFGVWRGVSFRYLLKSFDRGFGFDTFDGLPEDWHENRQGSYSSGGQVPSVAGGEFIVGEFEQSLPEFFREERPKAALINFDADLYSSTLCALSHARPVIDEKTILIFDEFLMNEHWEQDEYRALTEYCAAHELDYEVLAVCFFSKQVAVRVKEIT